MRPSLCDLATCHGTDKEPCRHGYTKTYDRLFAPLRYHPIRILEIGVFDGASLRMWEEYFPYAQIFGIDCDPACRQHENARSTVFIGDQGREDFLATVIENTGPLDVVIDDGSHWGKDQLASFLTLYPGVNPGGIYIVEDIHCSYWPEYGASYIPHLHQHIDQVLYPCPAIKADHADRRNNPDWPRIATELNDYERQTESIQLYTGLIIYTKRKEYL